MGRGWSHTEESEEARLLAWRPGDGEILRSWRVGGCSGYWVVVRRAAVPPSQPLPI